MKNSIFTTIVLILLFIVSSLCAQTSSQFIKAASSKYGIDREQILKKGISQYPKNTELLFMISEFYYDKGDYINANIYVSKLLNASDIYEKEIIKKKFTKLNLSQKASKQYKSEIAYNEATNDYNNIINNLYKGDDELMLLINNFRSKHNISSYLLTLKCLEMEIAYMSSKSINAKYDYYNKHSCSAIKYNINQDWLTNHQCKKCNGVGEIYSHQTTSTSYCNVCGGHGRCTNCGGDGKVPCYNHDSNGDGYCTICNNSGFVICGKCWGSGSCSYCEGKGKFIEYKSHYKTCPVCNGKGFH